MTACSYSLRRSKCGLIFLLGLFLVVIGHEIPHPMVLWLRRLLHFLRFRRQVRIESAEGRVIHGFGEQGQGGEELRALLRQGDEGGMRGCGCASGRGRGRRG